jgi:hypothetical protein
MAASAQDTMPRHAGQVRRVMLHCNIVTPRKLRKQSRRGPHTPAADSEPLFWPRPPGASRAGDKFADGRLFRGSP